MTLLLRLSCSPCSLLLSTALLLLPVVLARHEPIDIVIKYTGGDAEFLHEVSDYASGNQVKEILAKRDIVALTVESEEAFEKIKSLPGVEAVDLDLPRSAFVVRTMSGRVLQNLNQEEVMPYGIEMVQAPEVWPTPEVDENLVVCVVDTGYDLGHVDLPTERDGTTGTNTFAGLWPIDGDGHGTHCAGTVGAIGNNDRGVIGVRPDPDKFEFHIGKGLFNSGVGTDSTIMAAVEGCVEAGARVISMSLGGPGATRVTEEFYRSVYEDDGVLLVAAAGNDGTTEQSYPASFPFVMSVAAIDSNEKRASFSQCNDQVEIAAPGVNVLSTYPENRYRELSGTSMACPHVAGVAAEIWARFPSCTNTQIRNVLLRTSKALDDDGCYNAFGSGLVQANEAYKMLAESGCAAGDRTDNEPNVTGGCTQNPDFVRSENPFYGTCGGGSGKGSSASIYGFSRLCLVALVGILAALLAGEWD